MKLYNIAEDMYSKMEKHAYETNKYADEKELEPNYKNYGMVVAYADILGKLGNKTDVMTQEINGYIRINKLIVEEKTIPIE